MRRPIILAIALGILAVHPGPVGAQDLPVCFNNDYALCSHARCQCVDANGDPGPCIQNGGTDKAEGWSVCSCPIVKTGQEISYSANLGAKPCPERTPVPVGPFPPFAPLGPEVELLRSQYSLGDALSNTPYGKGTLNEGKMMVCDPAQGQGPSVNPALFAECLDMPCIADAESGRATCYCVNQLSEDATGKIVPWNTFGGDCGPNACDPGDGYVWSAATVDVTKPASDELISEIRDHGGSVPSGIPAFCPAVN